MCRSQPLLVLAVVLCAGVAWCAGYDAGAGNSSAHSAQGSRGSRRAVYNTRILRRTKYKCLGDDVAANRTLSYNSTSREVSIAYANWASARIGGEISYILLSEVLGYMSYLFDIDHDFDSHPINYAAGCRDPMDISGRDCNIDDPLVHITVETWLSGVRRVENLPVKLRPVLLSTLDYPLVDQYFIWPDVLDNGSKSNCSPLLDDYRTYKFRDSNTVTCHKFGDNNTMACPHVSSYFSPWKSVYDAYKKMDVIVRCSKMTAAIGQRDAAYLEKYTSLTGDTEVSCMSGSISGYDDGVWFSKSCRQNKDQCIPLVIQYSMDFAMQISYFLDMPLAVMVISSGKDKNWAEYFNVIQEKSCIFAWWTPDDSLLRQGRLPVVLQMPRTNKLEHYQEIYKTGLEDVSPRNYAWRHLPATDRHVPYLASKINFVNEDMNAMMTSSRLKKITYQHASASGFAQLPDPAGKYAGASWHELGFTSPYLVDELVAREVACEWVKQNRERWTDWIPSICPVGSESDDTLTKCLGCKAGFWCAGGTEPSRECEGGGYCPSNSSAPLPCPEGFTSARRSQALSDCNICMPDYLPVQSRCVRATVLVPAIVLPLLAATAALVFAYVRCTTKVRSEDEISFENCLRQLRRKLKLTPEDGFVLSNETPSFFRRFFSSRLIVIPKPYMEAAARLWRLEEFDLRAFDALCFMVGDSEYRTTTSERVASWEAQEGPGNVESEPASYTGSFSHKLSLSGVTKHGNIEHISTWLLDFSVSVLKDIQKISSRPVEDVGAHVPIDHFVTSPTRHNTTFSHRWATLRRLPRNEEASKCVHGNRRALETYFREKIMTVKLWQANSCALFENFKIPVEEMMATLNDDCYKRFKAIRDEPCGKELCTYCWNPQRGEFSCEDWEGNMDDVMGDTGDFMRQDDEHVQAVRWNERDVVEQSYENSSQLLKRVCKAGLRIVADESVFVAQLHRRAQLLDRAFKRKVTEILSGTPDHVCTRRDVQRDAVIMSSGPSLSHNTFINFNPMEGGDHDFASWLNQKTVSSEGTISIVGPPESTGFVTIRVGMFKEKPDQVTVFFGPIKTRERMKEKSLQYCFPHPWGKWPLTANIRDVIRLAIACDNPSQVLQIVRLFLSSQASTGLKVVRIKNKFLQEDEDVRKGLYGLDLTLNVLFEEPASGLKIICEIQVHDKRIHEVKSKLHKLYKIKRANHPASIA